MVTSIHKKKINHFLQIIGQYPCFAKWGKTWKGVCISTFSTTLVKKSSDPFQSGFIQGDSTTLKQLHTYNTFLEAVDSGKEVRDVFLDFSKALTEYGTKVY